MTLNGLIEFEPFQFPFEGEERVFCSKPYFESLSFESNVIQSTDVKRIRRGTLVSFIYDMNLKKITINI